MDEVIFPDLDETKDIAVECDNVNSLKNCIQAMGPRVRACQDPFHLIWRSTSKVRKEAQRRLSKQFHEALYVSDRVLRGRSDMFYRVRALLDKFPKEEITSSFEKWTGTMNNTLFQIWRGDLSPVCGDNIHVENGKYRSVIQSSSNESLHSELAGLCRRSMSYNVGMRVLSIFITKVNLRQAVKHSRIPEHIDERNIFKWMKTTLQAHSSVPNSNWPPSSVYEQF
ncbi:hypothetical protein DFJ73DRAFT_382272 [Zopfochytrium polystomum]|nr:hypothetical protein DFJ73DRAFT_382272 [Zopfochytrium polystomum]